MKKVAESYRISDTRIESFGIATLLVILVHAKPYNWDAYPSGLYKICELGSIGVDIFLFLSGLGLFYAMKKCDSVKMFYKRRILRILPSYMLITGVLFGIIVLMKHMTWTDYLLQVSTLYLWIQGPSITWYVSFVYLLYLCYPLIFRVLTSDNWKKNTVLMVGICLAVEICIFIWMPDFYVQYEFALARIPIFLIGAIFGRREYDEKGYSLWSVGMYGLIFLCIRVLLISMSDIQPDLYQIGVRISYIFGTLFVVECMPVLKRFIPVKWLWCLIAAIGRASLEIYLVHALLSQIYQFSKGFQNYNSPLVYFGVVVIPSITVIVFLNYLLRNRNVHMKA